MACLTLVTGDRLVSCGPPPAVQLGSPVSAKLLNASQIASFTITGSSLATITRVAGTRAYDLETNNNALVVNIALKGGELYPPQHDVSIEATLFGAGISNDTSGKVITGGANGKYVIAVDHGGGVYKVYGLGAPLEVLSVEGSSTGNGFVRNTFGVEDWQTGTTVYDMGASAYAALSTPAT